MLIYEVYAIVRIKLDNNTSPSRKLVGWTESGFLAKEYAKLLKQSKATIPALEDPPNFTNINVVPIDVMVKQSNVDIEKEADTDMCSVMAIPPEYMGIIGGHNKIITLPTTDWSMTAICTKEDGIKYHRIVDTESNIELPMDVCIENTYRGEVKVIVAENTVKRVAQVLDTIMMHYIKLPGITSLEPIYSRRLLRLDPLKIILGNKNLQKRHRIFPIQISREGEKYDLCRIL